MLVSVHIPKCAGTSFRHILRDIYRDALWLNYGTIFIRDHARPELLPQGVECIHGHFFADAFDDLIPDRTLVTWLRHPVERVVSNYHHFLRSPDMRDDCCRVLYERKLTLVQFAELDWMRNEATRYLAGKPLSAFEFVGIAERFTESLTEFTHRLGFSCPVAPRRENTNPERTTERYALSSRDYDAIARLNETDMPMYEEALARFVRPPVKTPVPVTEPALPA
jgi:hypothetical protein